jgi:hypothetical protein
MTIGIVVVVCLARKRSRCTSGHENVNLETHQLGRQVGEPIIFPLGPSILDDDVLPLHVAELK